MCCVVAAVTHRPGHEHNIRSSASWVIEKPKEGPRAKQKRNLSRGPSEDTPDTAVIQVLKINTCSTSVYEYKLIKYNMLL